MATNGKKYEVKERYQAYNTSKAKKTVTDVPQKTGTLNKCEIRQLPVNDKLCGGECVVSKQRYKIIF